MDKLQHREKIKALWVKMCNHDGIDEDESFCCFSLNNPFAKEYNQEMIKYQENRRRERV